MADEAMNVSKSENLKTRQDSDHERTCKDVKLGSSHRR